VANSSGKRFCFRGRSVWRPAFLFLSLRPPPSRRGPRTVANSTPTEGSSSRSAQSSFIGCPT
jgi:hypothetical protein